MGFTRAERDEMARADAEIEASFCLTNDDLVQSRQIDREAVLKALDSKQRKVAER